MKENNPVKDAVTEVVVALRKTADEFERAANYYCEVESNPTPEQSREINRLFKIAGLRSLTVSSAMERCEQRLKMLDNRN